MAISLERWREPLGIALVGVLVIAVDLGRRMFGNNDEARFPMLAQDVLAHGNWLFPSINGAVYANKPPLLTWLIALGSWPLGRVTEMTAVLPSACAGLATVLIIYAIGRDLFGREAGRYAALVALTTQGLFLHARLALPDMLMTCFMTASLWMFVRMKRDPARLYWLGFYGLMAAAFWTKGPAGLLPLVVGVVDAIVTRRSGQPAPLRVVPGLSLLGVLVGGWWVLGAFLNPAATSHALVVDQLSWYQPRTPTIATLTGPLRNFFGILFPWVLVMPVAIVYAWRFLRGRGAERDGVRFLVVWAGVIGALVALSNQQRFRYYLPLVPPASLLIGWWMFGAVVKFRKIGALPWRAYGIMAGATLAATVAFGLAKRQWPQDVTLPGSALEVLVLAAAIAVLVGALLHGMARDRLRSAFRVAWAAAAVLVVASYHWQLQRHNEANDYRALHALGPALQEATVVAALGLPELPLSFYFGRPVIGGRSPDQFARAVTDDPGFVVVVAETAMGRLKELCDVVLLGQRHLGGQTISLVRYVLPAACHDRKA